MKNRNIILIVTSILLFACIVASTLILLSKDKITITPKNIDSINQNNFTTKNNTVDYFNGNFAYISSGLFGDCLNIVNANGICKKIQDVDKNFKLLKDALIYIKNGDLCIENLHNKSKKIIANDVYEFLVDNNNVYYHSNTKESQLCAYNLRFKKTKVLATNIDSFSVNNDRVYIVDNHGELYSINIDCNEKTHYDFAPPYFSVYQPIALCENAFLYKTSNHIYTYSFDTNNSKTICIEDDCDNSHLSSFICNDNTIYLTYQAVEYDGSLVKEKQHQNNGIWQINPKSAENKKVSDAVFDRLYLFDDEVLIGTNHNGIYQINVETGGITEMVKYGML